MAPASICQLGHCVQMKLLTSGRFLFNLNLVTVICRLGLTEAANVAVSDISSVDE